MIASLQLIAPIRHAALAASHVEGGPAQNKLPPMTDDDRRRCDALVAPR